MKLFCRKYGCGPPLVILHGLYGSSDNWVSVAKILAGRYTVYLPDQRNHGQSPHSPVHDYESMRDDLYELVSELGLERFFLAGHSMGGKTAAAFSLKWPELLQGLLIADISPFSGENSVKGFEYHRNILETMLSFDLSKVTSRNAARTLLERKISSEKVTGFLIKNLERNPDNTFSWKLNVKALLDNLPEIMQAIDPRTTVQVTGFPVIFLKGEESDYLPESHFGNIKRVYPGAEFFTIPGAGHWLHADKPEEVISFLLKLSE